MGWITGRDLAGYADPKAFLDAKCSGEGEDGVATLVGSMLVGGSIYHAVIDEHWRQTGLKRRVILRADVRYDRTRADGQVFAYKIWPDLIDPDDPDCPEAMRLILTQPRLL